MRKENLEFAQVKGIEKANRVPSLRQAAEEFGLNFDLIAKEGDTYESTDGETYNLVEGQVGIMLKGEVGERGFTPFFNRAEVIYKKSNGQKEDEN